MNGVLHSEHVISRSGIRGFSTKVKTRTFTFLLFGALALRFFQPPGCGAKARFFFTNARRKAGVPTVSWSECTPAMQSIQFFYENFDWKLLREVSTSGPPVVRTQQPPADLLVNLRISLGTLVARKFDEG